MWPAVHKATRAISGEARHAFGLPNGRRVFFRSCQGAIDKFSRDQIVGWAAQGPEGPPLRVGLFVGGACLRVCLAALPRQDVVASARGQLKCGFQFQLDDIERACIASSGGLSIRAWWGTATVWIAAHKLREEEALAWARFIPSESLALANGILANVRKNRMDPQLAGDALRCVLGAAISDVDTPETQSPDPATLTHPKRLLRSPHRFDYTDRWGAKEPNFLPPYHEHVRQRWGMADECGTIRNSNNELAFLLRYIDELGPLRVPCRLPLLARQIDLLNAPHVAQPDLSEAMAYLLPKAVRAMPHARRIFTWAADISADFGVEDCLIRGDHVAYLRDVDDAALWPLSNFAKEYKEASPVLRGLDKKDPKVRELVYIHILLRAVNRPDFLRYIPSDTARALLDDDADGLSPLSYFLIDLVGGPLAVSGARIARLLSKAGVDFDTLTYHPLLPSGDRLDAARNPRPTGPRVDVQVIGPLHKASGLGVAARTSRDALRATHFTLNSVRYAVDDPAPELAAQGASRLRRAKVNLLHLNAEALPDVAAFGPDVMSGAYNIGFFFWELERPPPCHRLGVQLLDEIWVASDFCKKSYQSVCDIPVVNMGMAVVDAGSFNPKDVRAQLRDRFGFDREAFVCLTTFDSYSFVARKNPEGAIAAFMRAFRETPNARLIVKTHNRQCIGDPAQLRVWERIDALCAQLPNVVLVDESLPHEDVMTLKAGADCYLSMHRSEGWGFGMIEAMSLGIPVVCTGYSGNLEFCTDETAFLVRHTPRRVEKDDYAFVQGGQFWAEPDIEHAAAQLKSVYLDAALRTRRTSAAKQLVEERFSTLALSRRYSDRLAQIIQKIEPGDARNRP